MNTLIFSSSEDLSQAAHILRAGGLVAVPTETVYGLAANAFDSQAVTHIFKAKGRPNDNPLIIHIASLHMLEDLVTEISPVAKQLIDAFWPGPLTLIFKASPKVPKAVTCGLDTVAIRFPSHPVIKELIKASGLPLAAPSANTSGKPSPTNARRVIEDLEGKIEAIIDGGECEVGLESTVVDTTCLPPTILRPGGITLEMLKEILPDVTVDPAILNSLKINELPKAPGMKYTHYSPNAEVIIIEGELNKVIPRMQHLCLEAQKAGKRVGILATDETKALFKADVILSVGTMSQLSTIAAHLFETLRHFDDEKVDIIYSLSFPKSGMGGAIMNRLEKSAGHHIIKV
ncbi:threonylcarbamoyl-AMP synthase [Sporanaerobium hydrogeniformans]|uniref:Threonylcarbamoyl-AMP synthase n=1 Tax=Sporanaerobium hydrogeniformans TaxID=3072179 RepID=A0AC61DAE3_9FIRM|nr:L-threonylcarbamoyladenylate synthase [Sporanaerobium hydrogeniformans]PHV70215.1 threonylcarbamoyl-AMP synthase [Sporanaerobium hydrogeniformans]